MTAYPALWSLSTSCLFHRNTIKMHPSVSSDLSFSPPWSVTDGSVQSINLSLQSGPLLCWAKYRRSTHNSPHPRASHAKWDKRLLVERERNRGQINLPSVCHTLIPCHRLTSAKPSKWNSSAGFEYKPQHSQTEHSGWEYPRTEWTH